MTLKKTERDYDVVIIGGGPAGATAGFLLSEKGYYVLLIDKETFPREKPCGGLLTNKSISFLKRIYDEDLGSLLEKKVIDYVSSNWRMFHDLKKIDEGVLEYPFYYVKRRKYDTYLLKIAERKGVEVIEGEKVTNIDLSKDEVFTESGRHFRARHIIGADGVNSILRRSLVDDGSIEADYWTEDLGVALQQEINREHTTLEIDGFNIDLGILKRGYGWIFPNKDHILIGIGGVPGKDEDMMKIFERFGERLGLRFEKEKVVSHPVTLGNFIRKPIHENKFLVGDAAGFMDPISGEGIYYAHRSAEIATSVIQRKDEYPDLDVRKMYPSKLNSEVVNRLSTSRILREIWADVPEALEYGILKSGVTLFGNKAFRFIHGTDTGES